MKAFDFLEDLSYTLSNYNKEVSDCVLIDDAYWACKMYASEELQKILDAVDVLPNMLTKEAIYSLIEQRIKQLKSKKTKINES
jgi:hypothetical protein